MSPSTTTPLLSPAPLSAEKGQDRALRPKRLAEYIGQPKAREQLGIFIEAARKRSEPLDHTLIFGPPGLGKTTLAQIICAEMGAPLRQTSGPTLERPGDLAALLVSLDPGDALFIDEIHRLPPVVEEILYSAMEDWRIDILIGEGPEARSTSLELSPFTLIGATTRAGMLSAPLRDRFGIRARLEFYSTEELAAIAQRSAALLGMALDPQGALEIARRARGTPRIANRLLRRARDFAEVRGAPGLSAALASEALEMLEVDASGLDAMDRKLLRALTQTFNGKPVGLDNLATAIGEASDTIEDAIEPYLIQQGFMARAPRGRIACPLAYAALGLPEPTAPVAPPKKGRS